MWTWFVFIELLLFKNIVVFLLNCQIRNAPRKNGASWEFLPHLPQYRKIWNHLYPGKYFFVSTLKVFPKGTPPNRPIWLLQQTSNTANWMKDRMGEVRTILFKHRSYRLQALTCLLSLKKMIEQVPALVNVITETTHSSPFLLLLHQLHLPSPHLTLFLHLIHSSSSSQASSLPSPPRLHWPVEHKWSNACR